MKILKNNKAFTLIELLIAMTLMFMFIFAFTPFMLSGLKNLEYAGEQRDEMYNEKGSLDDNLSLGVTNDRTNDGSVSIIFNQPSTGKTFPANVAGQYLKSVQEKLVTFLGRDLSSLEISPSLIVRKPQEGTIVTITCADMQFANANYFSLYAGNESNIISGVTFAIDPSDPTIAYMTTQSGLSLDVTKDHYIRYFYDNTDDVLDVDVKAKLNVTTYGIVAVGEDGTYIYQDGNNWTKTAFSGTNANKDLHDIIWTGKQYVTVGDTGSWNYTDTKGEWQSIKVHTYDYENGSADLNFTCLDAYGDEICAGGYSIQTGYTGAVNANEAVEVVVTNPANIQAEMFDTKTKEITYYDASLNAHTYNRPDATSRAMSYITSITSATIGENTFRLWGNYSYFMNYLTTTIRHGMPEYGKKEEGSAVTDNSNYIQLSPYDRISDIEHNGYTDHRAEIIAVCDTTGKAYSSKDGYNWKINTDSSWEEWLGNPITQKPSLIGIKRTNVIYNVYNKTSGSLTDKGLVPMQLDDWFNVWVDGYKKIGWGNFGYAWGYGLEATYGNYSGIYAQIAGQKNLPENTFTTEKWYTFSRYGVYNETIYEKTFIAQIPFANNYYGALNSVAYGEPDATPNGVWVAGGSVYHSRDVAAVRKTVVSSGGYAADGTYYLIRPDDPDTAGVYEFGMYTGSSRTTANTIYDDPETSYIDGYYTRLLYEDYAGNPYDPEDKVKVNMAVTYDIDLYDINVVGDKKGSDGHGNAPLIYRFRDGDAGDWCCAEIHTTSCKKRGTPPTDIASKSQNCMSHYCSCIGNPGIIINDVEFINGRFYAVGNDGWMLQSDDGMHWIAWQDGSKKDLYGIAGIEL